jgi:hypothetical protein
VALPELGGAAGVAELDAGEELEQELAVEIGDVIAQQAGPADPLEQLDSQRAAEPRSAVYAASSA